VEPLSPEHAAIGRAIRRLRRERGYSQEGFADECGLDRSYMGAIERGERNFSFGKLMTICTSLNASLVDIAAAYERERAAG
jgi:transcriptional regulator with XRE-family HTH domain